MHRIACHGLAACLLVLLCGIGPASSDAADANSDVATRLAAVRDTSTADITTIGRKTGKRHTVPVWFVVDGPAVLLGTLNVKRDWVRNAAVHPDVELQFGTLHLRGRLSTITDAATNQRFHDLLAKKYWIAWLGSFVSQGPEGAFRVDGLVPVP